MFDPHKDHTAESGYRYGEGGSFISNNNSSDFSTLDLRSPTGTWQSGNHFNQRDDVDGSISYHSSNTANGNSASHLNQSDTGDANQSAINSGSVKSPVLGKMPDTQTSKNPPQQLPLVRKRNSVTSASVSKEIIRQRTPSPTLEERRQAQAISRSFLELRIAEALAEAQHQTQQGPQETGSDTNKDKIQPEQTPTPLASQPVNLPSSSPAAPSSEQLLQHPQVNTDVSAATPDASETVTGETATRATPEAPVDTEGEEEGPAPIPQTLITPQQSPPSKNRYTIASAIIPTATQTTITATVSEYDGRTDKDVQEERQVLGDDTMVDPSHTSTTSASTTMVSPLTLGADTSSNEDDSSALDHLSISATSNNEPTDDNIAALVIDQTNPMEVDPSSEKVGAKAASLLETIKDLSKTYPHQPSQLPSKMGTTEELVKVDAETIVFALPSIGPEHHDQHGDPSQETTLLLSTQEEDVLSDSTMTPSQGNQELNQEEATTATSDSLTTVLLETIQPLLVQAPTTDPVSVSEDSKGGDVVNAEPEQGATLERVDASSVPNGVDDDNLTPATALDSFDTDVEMSTSTGMDLDADTFGPTDSDNAVAGKVLDIGNETDMSVDLPDLTTTIFPKEMIYPTMFNDGESLQPAEILVDQTTTEEKEGVLNQEEPTAAVIETPVTQEDTMAANLDLASHVGFTPAIQTTEAKDIGVEQPESSIDSGLLSIYADSPPSIQGISTGMEADYVSEDLVKTLLGEAVPVVEPALTELDAASGEMLSMETPIPLETLLGDVLSSNPESVELNLPQQLTETTPGEIMANVAQPDDSVMVVGVVAQPDDSVMVAEVVTQPDDSIVVMEVAVESTDQTGQSDLQVVDGTTDTELKSGLQEDDESGKVMSELRLGYDTQTEEVQDVSETMSDLEADGPQTVPNVKSLAPSSTTTEGGVEHHHDTHAPSSPPTMSKSGQRRRSATSPHASRNAEVAAESDKSVLSSQGHSRHPFYRNGVPPRLASLPSWHYVPGADLAFLSEMVASTADLQRFRREMQWMEERAQHPRRDFVSEQVLDKALGLTRNVKLHNQQMREDRRDKGTTADMSTPPHPGLTTTSVQFSTESRLALSMVKMGILTNMEERTRLERDQEALRRSLTRTEAKILETQKAQDAAEQEIREMMERRPALETELQKVRQLESEYIEEREKQRQQVESEIRELEATLQMLQQQQQQQQGHEQQQQHSPQLVGGPASMSS
ncbi:hypothetical protein B0O80DRAFT_424991 [Mortierella sp. GBAus27b]|nr:hypothetical protein BGX31_004517 [Mortierella sp. GBA43]KAI8357076.1 hypothetical protein B0O80DRAFT_424991 [Mortierella sp. GBAus27b]